MKRGDVADDMVGRHYQQRVAAAACGNGGKRDGGGGIATGRLEDQRLWGRAGIGQLLLDRKSVV